MEGLEHILKVKVLLDYNSLQLIITSNGHAKVIANRAKICHLKFTVELLFKGVNSGFTINNFNIIYINWYNEAIYRGKRQVLSYKNTIVSLKLLKAKAYKEVINNFILYIRWLLKAIKTFKKVVDLSKFTKAIIYTNLMVQASRV